MFSWPTRLLVAQRNIMIIPNQKVARQKNVFFLSFFRWASSNLRDTFTMIFTQNNSIFRWAVHQLITFFYSFEVSRGSSNQSLKNYGFICDAIFSSLVCMHTNHLSIIKDCWIRNMVMCMKTGSWLSVWTEPGQWFFSQYYIHLLRKSTRTHLLLCYRCQISAQA